MTLLPLHRALCLQILHSNELRTLKEPSKLPSKSKLIMSWTYKNCTFINSPSKKSTCEICLNPASSSPSTSNPPRSPLAPKWPCKACTFLNSYKNSNCEICGTRSPVASISSFEDLNDVGLDEDSDSNLGSVFFPLRSCKRNACETSVVDENCGSLDGFHRAKAKRKVVDVEDDLKSSDVAFDCDSGTVKDDFKPESASRLLKILSYNVWFREDLELYKRMKALGDLVQLHSPDLICFQEVTPNIYDIFRQTNWWKTYRCSVSDEKAGSRPYFCMQLSKLPIKSFSCKPFNNSIMGRELCVAEVEVPGLEPLVVATSHLESPCPAPPKWDQMYSKERVEQAKEALNFLKKYPNVIFCGDTNWDDKLDGDFPLLDGWVDAWMQLRPRESGWTYDTKSNQMLTGNRTLQKRLDRFVCNLHDFKINRINMIGMEAIPGISYCKEKKVKNEMKKLVLPVLPSDHYGLLVTISTT